MPTYEYACKKCGNHLEAVQKFTDGPLTECPDCGGELRKVFGNVGIVFKGSGFYKNDSRSAQKDGTASSTAGVSNESSGAKSSTSSESTPTVPPSPAPAPAPAPAAAAPPSAPAST